MFQMKEFVLLSWKSYYKDCEGKKTTDYYLSISLCERLVYSNPNNFFPDLSLPSVVHDEQLLCNYIVTCVTIGKIPIIAKDMVFNL